MSKLKVTVVFDTQRPPPQDQDYAKEIEAGASEPQFDVFRALRECGHEPRLVGIRDDLPALIEQLRSNPPELVFNLCESFRGLSQLDVSVAGVLEMLGLHYTGAAMQGLVVARDKALSKKVLAWHGIRVPEFALYRIGEPFLRPSVLRFPLIVKPLLEDASLGVAEASICNDDKALEERITYVHTRLRRDAIVEELIHGRELYVGVLGNAQPMVLPVVEMVFGEDNGKPRIATFKAKWDEKYRTRKGIHNQIVTDLEPKVLERVGAAALTAYRNLELRDYGRVDLRLTHDNEVYVLEANPNPFLARGEDLAMAAEASGLTYPALIRRIVDLAMERVTARTPEKGTEPAG
jgi:D-alanine-D-alanine ligase